MNKYDDSVNREVVSRSEIAREVADELKLNFIDTYNYIYNNNFVYRDFVHFAEKIDNFRLAKYIDYDIAGPTLIEPKIYGFSENLPFFVEGLCLPEPWGCWSNGDCSFFFFRTDNEYIAEFDVKPFFAKEKTKQVVTVYVNCREQGEYVFESGKEIQKIIIDLPKSEKIHIMFKYKDVESPKDLGLSDDDRKIAIGFKSMEIKNKQ